jgi:sulfopyruvate decarboxylase TPP-binding subunit
MLPAVAMSSTCRTIRCPTSCAASISSSATCACCWRRARKRRSGIAAGLYLGGRLPTVLLQSSGIGNSLNALTSLLLPYQIPVLMVVSMRGDSGEWNAAQVPMGRALRGIFESIGVPHTTVESPDRTADTVRCAGRTAFGTRTIGACLLPRRVTTGA